VTEPVEVLHFTDPGCPWAYSAEPFLTALRWRYATGLAWRRVMIGLTESTAQYDARGYKPERSARGRIRYRRFGMPYAFGVRPRNMATGRACRAVKAAELQGDQLAEAYLRWLRFGFFTTTLLMDTDDALVELAHRVDGLDPDRLARDLTSDAVESAYQRDWAETRNAAQTGRPAIAQTKTANTDGDERFTAPSLVFRRGGAALVAGGWQTLEAYDVLIANLAPDLPRRPPATPAEIVAASPHGVTTFEAAVACTAPNDAVDRDAVLAALITLAFEGAARRVELGDDALWLPTGS
jgi:predicted DsbA family dithiol-disulfide isomerase